MKNRGFTIIELVIVIAIVGILGTAGVFSYQASLAGANYTRAYVDMKDIAKAAQIVYYETGHYPVDEMPGQPTTEPSASNFMKNLKKWPDAPCGYLYDWENWPENAPYSANSDELLLVTLRKNEPGVWTLKFHLCIETIGADCNN